MPTRSRRLAARLSASFLSMSKCVRSASRICFPTVCTGFGLVIGSWKIIAMSRPLILRSCLSFMFKRSRSSNVAVPPVTRPLRARIPRMASEVTLLPHPDSPTIPSVSPGAMSKVIPLTAWTVPRDVVNSTRRSSTVRSGSLATPTQLRVEGLPKPIADQVEAEHGHDDRHAGDDRQVRCGLEIANGSGKHRPPLRRGRILRPEAEEAETGDVDDRRGHGEGALDDHGRDRVREDVARENRASRH